MDLKSAAQVIRDSVSMEQILDLYGYKAKHGFIICPFHGDKNPSLKIYDGRNGRTGWYCFGCGRGGSVIDFVKEQEGCDSRTAVRTIDSAMHLNLFQENENPYLAEEERHRQEKLDRAAELLCNYYDSIIEDLKRDLRLNDCLRMAIEEKPVIKRTQENWMFLLTYDDEQDYREYLIGKVQKNREDVIAWRMKERRKVRSA